ncbi:nucleoid occlusion protein [Geomonas sp. Red276]
MTAENKEPIYKKGKLYSVPISDLHRDPDQPRKNIEVSDIDEFKTSIEAHGQLTPILFRKDQDGQLILVAGERRYRACCALGHTHINGIFIESAKYDEIALVDNIQRVDLHPIDEAEAIFNLKEKHGYTQEQLGDIIGKAQNTISIILDLMKIKEEVRNQARHNKDLSRNALLEIAKIKSIKAQQKAYDALIAKLSAPKKSIKRPRLKDTEKTIKVADSTMEHIKGIKVEALGEDREAVVSKLQQLLQEIQDKLASIGS